MRIMFICLLIACSSSAATPQAVPIKAPSCTTDCPPSCPGVELGYTLRDALADVLIGYCPSHAEIANCEQATLSFWCPTEGACNQVLCGEQLTMAAACIAETAATGTISDPCFVFYDRIISTLAGKPNPAPIAVPKIKACVELCPTPSCLGNDCFCEVAGLPTKCDQRIPLVLCEEIGCFEPMCDGGGCYCPDEIQHPRYCAPSYQRCAVLGCDGLICPYDDSAACLCTFEDVPSISCINLAGES